MPTNSENNFPAAPAFQLSPDVKARIARMRKRLRSPANRKRHEQWLVAMSEPSYREAMRILAKENGG